MLENAGFPLVIIQGGTFRRTITYKDSDDEPIPLIDYTAAMQFRRTVEATGYPVISLSTSDGSIIIDEDNGTITPVITSTVTAELDANEVLYYDLFIYSGSGVATRLLSGIATVSGSVTR